MIPATEIEARWERARQQMKTDGLDALLVGDKHNYWYFTGHLSREFDKKLRPMLFLLTPRHDPALIVYAQTEKDLKQTCPAACVHGYEDVPFPPQLLVDVLRQSGLAQGRVGMEFGPNERLGLAFTHYAELADSLPQCRFVDASTLLTRMRALKSPLEVELIEQACAFSLTAWERALPQFRLGMNNHDIARILASQLCLAGSDFNLPGHVTVGNGVAGQVGYQSGEVVWCDFGASFGGYQADLARRAIFGRPRPEQAGFHATINAILDDEIEFIGPGKRACDVASRVTERLEEYGYPPLGPKKRVGHGLGLSAGEPPSLSLADETLLEPGMVLTPEPRFNLESGERVHVEEVVLVTSDGCRKLTGGAERLEILSEEH